MHLRWMDLELLQCQAHPGAPCHVLGQLGMAPLHLQAMGQEEEIQIIQLATHTPEEEVQAPIPQEEESHQEEVHPMAIQAMAVQLHLQRLQVPRLHNRQEEQASPAAIQRLQHHLQLRIQDSGPWIHGHHWTGQGSPCQSYRYLRTIRTAASWTCSRCSKFWYDRSTFAIATWRGDAQRYWLTQVLEPARIRHDQWLQSTPAQRATLEPAYILGDRKHIPEAASAVESLLRTELLEVIPKPLAEACMQHGYCTAELIVWYIMKQLILPPDVNEVTMQNDYAEGDSYTSKITSSHP